MNWPTSQDYNEAIQNPASSFSDPALKNGEVTVNAIGLPVPRSGNFADVYQFQDGNGKMWAVKCFTRKVAGLQERYAKIDEHLSNARLPFTVGVKFFEQGIRIRGEWFPLLKMEWIEGFPLNEFVRDNAGKPQYLHALMTMWAKLTARLRDSNFAHADLQHGNVLLVPASSGTKLGLKLIDYDGMWVPALADRHSGEIGHPNFQHPQRLKDRLYNADVDRFPHLVIGCALRATLIGGQALWDKFDNGDNLLFKEADLKDLASASVFHALWDLKDDVLCTLLGKLALSARDPLRKTPWLDDLLLAPDGARLSDEEERKLIQWCGVAPHFIVSQEAALGHLHLQREFNLFDFADDDTAAKPAERPAAQRTPKVKQAKPAEKAKSKLPIYIGGGALAAALLIGIIVVSTGGKKNPPTDATKEEFAKVMPAPSKRDDTSRPPKKDDASTGKVDETPAKTVPPAKIDETPAKTDPPPKRDLKKEMPADPPKKDPEVAKEDPVVVAKLDPKLDKKETLVEPKPVPVEGPPATVKKDPMVDQYTGVIKELWTAKRPKTADIHYIDFTRDSGRLICKLGLNGNMQVINAKNGSPMQSFSVSDEIVAIARTFPNDIVAAPDLKKRVVGWDLKNHKAKYTINDLMFGLPGGWPAAANQSLYLLLKTGDVGVFSSADGTRIGTIDVPPEVRLESLLVASADGQVLAGWSAKGELYLKSPASAKWKRIYRDPALSWTLELSPNGEYLCICRDAIRILDVATGRDIREVPARTAFGLTVRFTPDSRKLVFVGTDGALHLWDIESSKSVGKKQVKGVKIPHGMAVSPNGRFAATATDDSLQMFDLGLDAKRVAKDPD